MIKNIIRFLVFCVSVAVTCGFRMPGPTYRASFDRQVNWSPYDVYFPGPTNHQDYYHHSKHPPIIPQYLQTTEPPRINPTTSTDLPKIQTTKAPPPPVDVIKVSPTTEAPKTNPTTVKVNDIGGDDVCIATVGPPDADSQCCGVEASSSNYIVGGNATKLEQYPWLVMIQYYNANEKRHKRLCGGFLISGRYVLTAAHCLVGEVEQVGTPVNIILGDYDATNDGPDCLPARVGVRPCTDGAISVPIESTLVHPKHYHDNNVSYNDIALVKLSRTVEYTNFIRPICLPKTDVTISPPSDLRLYTAGWGAIKQRLVFQMGQKMFAGEYDNVKRHVDLPLKVPEECREKLGSFIGPSHLCAGGEKGKDSCRGDSGGPLMHENDGIFESIGIVSAGTGKKPCGTEGFPAIYTKVFNYIDWIKENTKS